MTLVGPMQTQIETTQHFTPFNTEWKSLKKLICVFVYLQAVVACGEGQIDDQTKLLLFFLQCVQQVPGTKDIRRWKLTVQSLKYTIILSQNPTAYFHNIKGRTDFQGEKRA